MEFYKEDILYRELTKEHVRSNKIKRGIHEVLTQAIFLYSPCKELLVFSKKVKKPTAKDWKPAIPKWVSLTAEPFQHVRTLNSKIFQSHSTNTKAYFVVPFNRQGTTWILPSSFCNYYLKPQEMENLEQS